MTNEASADEYELDPVFLHARREALIVLIIFAVFATYVLSVSYWLGTAQESDGNPAADIELGPFGGLPLWVFWGIVVPWLAANVVTGWFCFFYIKDDDLEPSGASEENGGLDSPRETSQQSGDSDRGEIGRG